MIKLLIFDFDGTLADTKSLYYNSIYKHLKNEGIHVSKEKFHNELLGIKLHDILKKLGIKENIQKIKNNVHKDVFENIKIIKIARDVGYLKDIKIKKIIVSNTETKNILKVIRYKKIKYFKEIYGGDKFKNKVIFIKNYMKKHKLKKNEAIYIGDMIRDIKTSKKAGIIGVSISHKISWNSRKELLQAQPDYLITSLKELNQIIK